MSLVIRSSVRDRTVETFIFIDHLSINKIRSMLTHVEVKFDLQTGS